MHVSKKLVAGIALSAGLATSGAAFAASSATAVTDLNIRSGPGPHYPVTGLVGAGQQAIVTGCIQGGKWCQIDNGGWVYSDYLTADLSGSAVVMTERYPDMGVPSVSAHGDRLSSANLRWDLLVCCHSCYFRLQFITRACQWAVPAQGLSHGGHRYKVTHPLRFVKDKRRLALKKCPKASSNEPTRAVPTGYDAPFGLWVA